jgi:hypothetical protein
MRWCHASPFIWAIVINKKNLYGTDFRYADSFYKYACGLIFGSANLYFIGTIISWKQNYRFFMDSCLLEKKGDNFYTIGLEKFS